MAARMFKASVYPLASNNEWVNCNLCLEKKRVFVKLAALRYNWGKNRKTLGLEWDTNCTYNVAGLKSWCGMFFGTVRLKKRKFSFHFSCNS